MDSGSPTTSVTGLRTLAIDIGGTRLKAGLLDPGGDMVVGPNRVDTPRAASPEAVVEALLDIATPLGAFDRISIGFPGVVRYGHVLTAPNLGTKLWRQFPLARTLSDRLGKPARMLNDAEVQGLGVIDGQAIECVITLGTGMGFAVFDDGRPAPHLELSQHPIHKGMTYDAFIGVAALRDVGRKRWNKRVKRALSAITMLVGYDMLYIGGGNAKHLTLDLPPNVKLVSNEAGITGGVRLWDPRLDPVFRPHAAG
ncbi:ROK family protein [Rhodopila sp.]|jgi:polyphosphate glucokinase|uniref:ROK family protein n=1 Tax=Rhodopila sp. TaxID=2480087 RepID=UPI002C34AE3A|nr:ROK family protein [Rhodopila sp.]HVZ10706.1 ROK family protein [Rhodopila sp.]